MKSIEEKPSEQAVFIWKYCGQHDKFTAIDDCIDDCDQNC